MIRVDVTRQVKLLSQVAGWVVMFIGALVLVGWILDNNGVKSVFSGLVSMKPNTALAFILFGVALQLLQEDVCLARARRLAAICAAATVAIGLLTVAQYTFDWNPGLDQWWFQDHVDGLEPTNPGRIGLNTALCLLAFGIALLILDHSLLGPYPAQAIAMVAMGGAFAALIGYAYSIESLYGIASYSPMALHTSIALIVIGVGIFCLRPAHGLMTVLVSDQTGSKVARRLLPAAILIPFFTGFLELRGVHLGFYDAEFGAALVTTTGMILFGTLIWWTASSLNSVDQQRRLAERKRDLYQHMFVQSKDSITVIDPSGYYVEQNPEHEQLFGYRHDEWHSQTPALILGAKEFGRMADDLRETGMYRGEALCRTKSGRHVPFDVSAFSVRDEHDRVVCSVAIMRDMTDRYRAEQAMHEAHEQLERKVQERTSALMESNEVLKIEVSERKQAEEAVRESETRFRAIFNQASVGIAEVRLDGRFLRVNAKLCEILGRSENQLIETTFQELTHPDDLQENLALLQEILDGRSDSYSMEKRYVRPNGTAVWCRLAVSLVRTSAGCPMHFISVVEDISHRKRTTDALRTIAAATASVTDEDCFRSFVSHLAPALAVKYAFVGELLEGKPERVRTLAAWAGREHVDSVAYDLQGTPCAHVVARRVACFYPQDLQQQFPKDPFLAEIRAESYYGLPLLDRAGRVLGLLSVMHDQPLSLLPGMEQMLAIFAARAGIELERKRTVEALRLSDQALRQLIDEREQLAQDLHDGMIQSIYAAGLGLEEARRLVQEQSPAAVDQIKTVIGDLNSLIEDVRNHIVRRPREIKSGSQLKLALERLVRVLRTSGAIDIIAVIDRAAADQLRPGEATHVYYIAAEALSNAVRHSQARHCFMALRVVRGAVRFEVSDSGCGFDPSSASHAGHGLRNLSDRAAKLGTQLRLVSSPGGGTRLIVDLPKESSDDQTEA